MLRTMRANAGVSSQLELAAFIRTDHGTRGIPLRRYWEIENGYRVPSATERRDIAKFLKVSDDDLPWLKPAAPAMEAQAS